MLLLRRAEFRDIVGEEKVGGVHRDVVAEVDAAVFLVDDGLGEKVAGAAVLRGEVRADIAEPGGFLENVHGEDTALVEFRPEGGEFFLY